MNAIDTNVWIYSEDIAENDDFHGLEIVNPFRKGGREKGDIT